MKRALYDYRPGAVSQMIRQQDELVVHTKYHDDHVLDQNQRIRNAALISEGDKCDWMAEGDEVRFAFSIPGDGQWALFQRDYPDIYRRLMGQDGDEQRFKAARELAILKPGWVVIG